MKTKKMIFQSPQLDFEKKMEMYVVKDECSFVFSIPKESFSVKIESEQDFEHFENFGTIFGHSDFRSELVANMKKVMAEFAFSDWDNEEEDAYNKP